MQAVGSRHEIQVGFLTGNLGRRSYETQQRFKGGHHKKANIQPQSVGGSEGDASGSPRTAYLHAGNDNTRLADDELPR